MRAGHRQDETLSDVAEGGSALLRGAGWHALWNYVPMVAGITTNVVVTSYTARKLGLAPLGLFSVLVAVIALLQTADFSLSTAIQRVTAIATGDHPEDARARAKGELERASACYGLFGLIVLAGGLLLVPFSSSITTVPESLRGDFRTTAVLIVISASVVTFTAAPQGVLAGLQRFDLIAVAVVVGAVVNLLVVVTATPHLGLPALGVAQLVSVAFTRVVVAFAVRRAAPWFEWRPRRISRAEVQEVMRSGGTLVVFSIALQVITATDLLVVGGIDGPHATGELRLGVAATGQAAAAIFQGYDVIFPALASSRDADAQVDATRWLTRVACALAGAVLGLLVCYRDHVAPVLAGTSSETTARVVVLLSFTWAINTLVHGWCLVLIARGLAARLMKLVLAEVVANLVLTLLLVRAWGAWGSAAGTLVVVCVTNLLWVPLLLRDIVRRPAWVVVADGAPSLVVGGAASVLGYEVGTTALGGFAGLTLAGAITVAMTIAVQAVALGREGRRTALKVFARGPRGHTEAQTEVR